MPPSCESVQRSKIWPIRYPNTTRSRAKSEIMLFMPRRSTQTGVPSMESQLARRFVLIPRESRNGPYPGLLPGVFCFKGMIADFAIHDKGDGQSILFTMRTQEKVAIYD